MRIAAAKQATLSSKQQKTLQEQSSTSFGRSYFQLCQLYSLPIQSHIINHEPDTLVLNVDAVHKDEEWSPILIALKKNRDLVRISIFSDSKDTKHMVKEVGNRFQDGGVAVKSVFRILPELMSGIRDGLLFNSHLRILDISGIPLREVALKLLAKGIMNNAKIQYLSFSRCRIGDSGVFILAPSIRTVKHLRILNFSGCCLTEKGAHIVSAFLKSLAVRRQADLWAYSLRLSPMDTDPSLPFKTSKGAPKPLKRLIMCQNELGDKGAIPLFDLLYEEVGLGALDLHNNQLTNKSGLKALEVLKVNRDLVILDLKVNKVDPAIMEKISHYLLINEKAKQLARPGLDHDFVVLDEKAYMKPVIFGEQATPSTMMQTQSSIAKFHVRSSQLLTHEQRKKLLIHAKPKFAPSSQLKGDEKGGTAKVAKQELFDRIKNMQKANSKLKNKQNQDLPILSPQQKLKNGTSSSKKCGSTKHSDDFQEIDKILDALDSYYEKPVKINSLDPENQIVISIPPSSVTFKKKSSKAKTATVSISNSLGEKKSLINENLHLKRRVDELEFLVSSFLSSIPVPERFNSPTKKAEQKETYSPSNVKDVPHIMMSSQQTTADIPSQKVADSQRDHNPAQTDIHLDILKIQGALKQPPSSIQDLVGMLEASLFGFSNAIDRLAQQ